MKTIRKTPYTHRLLARIVIEASTPLSIGTGTESIITDSLVALDVNGLPFIPATALAGVFRHLLSNEDSNKIFGYQATDKANDGKGSRIIFTSAQLIGKNKKVIDGIESIDFNDPFYHHFLYLPIRQHVRINDRGTAEKGGKYDEQIIFKGTRFCFEIEIIGTKDEIVEFNRIKELLQTKTFRIGSGTRNGFGEISIIQYQEKSLDLSNPTDLEAYLHKSSDLSDDSFWQQCPSTSLAQTEHSGWTFYEIELMPKDFFLFGSGHGNDIADISPVTSTIITSWDKEEAKFKEQCILLPGTSVKGALSHRIAFHYNIRKKIFADKLSEKEYEKYVGDNNIAVKKLFGSRTNFSKKEDVGSRGNVLFSDIILSDEPASAKLLNHVAIDRFTGGNMNGALFHEQVNRKTVSPFTLNLLVHNTAFADSDVEYAFETALRDLCSGLLPLGGGNNRGHGCFNGTIKKNNQLIYPI